MADLIKVPSFVGGFFNVRVFNKGVVKNELSFKNRVTREGLNALWATTIGSTPKGGISSYYCAMLRWSTALFIGNEGRLFLDILDWGDFTQGGTYDRAVVSSIVGFDGQLHSITFNAAANGGITSNPLTLTPSIVSSLTTAGVWICGFLITNSPDTVTASNSAFLWATAGTSEFFLGKNDQVELTYTLITSSSTIYPGT